MEKNNKGLIILVVILIIMVLSLGGYIVYDKLIDNNKNDVVDKTDDKVDNNEDDNKVVQDTKEESILGDYFGTKIINIDQTHITTEVSMRLIDENLLLSETIKIIVNKDLDIITKGEINKIFDNDTIILIIESYCMMNNIKIQESEEDNEEFEENIINYEGENIDIVKLYLNEISRRKLLTLDEEIKLTKRIKDGDEEAKKIFIESNLRLVVSVARKHLNQGLSFLDLIQEGNIGLMKAVDKFDSSKGYRFSTYATWWIRQAITRAIADQAKTIRVPVHMVETINKLKRVQRQMTLELDREPTEEELAKALNTTEDKVREIIKISLDPLSLETPIGEEDDSHLGDFVKDDSSLSPEEYAINEVLKDEISELLLTLTEREEQVIKLRFGLIDGTCRTLEEVGTIFGVTRERIRQIEAKALRKLRHPSRSKKLKDYLVD